MVTHKTSWDSEVGLTTSKLKRYKQADSHLVLLKLHRVQTEHWIVFYQTTADEIFLPLKRWGKALDTAIG